MKAIILAAGRGTRLGELTQDIPKCLLPINGKPIIDIWIDKLVGVGVDDIIINTHHCADKMVAHFDKETSVHIDIIYEKELLGSAGAIYQNKNRLKDSQFFIIYADVWTDMYLEKMITVHELPKPAKPKMTIGLYEADNIKSRGVVEVKHGMAIGFEEKPENPKSKWAFSGVALAEPSILRTLNKNMRDVGRDWLPIIIKKHKVAGFFVLDGMIDIGTPESYEQANKEAKNG